MIIKCYVNWIALEGERMKAYKRLFFGVLTVVFLLSGCGATVTAGLLKSKIGFIGETGKNNMKLYERILRLGAGR